MSAVSNNCLKRCHSKINIFYLRLIYTDIKCLQMTLLLDKSNITGMNQQKNGTYLCEWQLD